MKVPRATYRVQLNRDFTFEQAAAIVPYLDALGVSHLYCSPYLKARSGSQHGYDIVDHNALNPEIGDEASYAALIAALRRHSLGQVLDVVPNHMAVGGDNAWWLDVLEHGPSSPYASYFDIDWRPLKEELRGKVLLPVLGEHYGKVLERGEIQLRLDAPRGQFMVDIYDMRLPLDPRTYPQILDARLDQLDESARALIMELIAALQQLPARSDPDPDRRAHRLQSAQPLKRHLASLCESQPALRAHLDMNVARLNGTPGHPESFDALHFLLEQQAYRLSYWRVASDEINYRRFFDINDLAGLRVENPQVFEETHRFVLDLIRNGQLDALRIDHPDGLADPAGYCRRLQERVGALLGSDADDRQPFYLIVEKILASYERLPDDWPVAGTTGYDFANLVTGLLIDGASERRLTRIYERFIDRESDFNELLYECKRLVVRNQLSSELTVLATLLDRIAQSNRSTRDYTLNGLREALTEIVACFPVYRSYVTAEGLSEQDRRFLQWAVSQAKQRIPAGDVSIFNFIHDILTLQNNSTDRARCLEFVTRFQQYTAPVTAKAMEDTALYRYARLVALNEVGGDPRVFGISCAAFHHANLERAQRWPHSMLASSTHDTKRSEDVRARIALLSELPDEWRRRLSRWSRLNRSKRHIIDEKRIPSRNDEYLFYQTLLGAWPLEELDEHGLEKLRARVEAYMLKALREAKVRTSWINPNPDYENGVTEFIRALLRPSERNLFLADFLPFQRRLARLGLYNSLSQTLLKLTSPGVPDIYQGNELWTFQLVDPDNRQPVDYARRQALLEEVRNGYSAASSRAVWVRQLLDNLSDGRAKLLLIWRALQVRKDREELFRQGGYQALSVEGARADHICAFARTGEGGAVITAVSRWFSRLLPTTDALPIGDAVWADTRLVLPEGLALNGEVRNELTGEVIRLSDGRILVAEVFSQFPVALISNGYVQN